MTQDSVPEVIGNQTYKPDISQGQCALPFRRKPDYWNSYTVARGKRK